MNFEDIVGDIFTSIKGLEAGSDQVTFTTESGKVYEMYHDQDCCESVYLEDVNGDVSDLLNTPILNAVEDSSDENPPDVKIPEYQDCYTWTFYRISTIKGTVVIRWYGDSNGYYSTNVSFREKGKGRFDE